MGVRLDWTQPQCEACWISHETVADGDNVAIRQPVTTRPTPIEVCAWCGSLTIVGIYKRVDPATVPHPRAKVDE